MKRRTSALIAAAALAPAAAPAATVTYMSNTPTGGGVQNTFYLSNTISGTMQATLPEFNPSLGTLIKAEFEWAPSITGAWTADPNTTGTVGFSLSGPADVSGQPMGSTAVAFTGPMVDYTPIPYYDANYLQSVYTSGAFFNSLIGVGNETVSWVYSGTSTLSGPAIGLFDWGGTAHVTYTYIEVPEPASIGVLFAGSALLIRRRIRR